MSPLTLAHLRIQVPATSHAPFPAAGSSPQADGRLPGRRSDCRSQSRPSGPSRPLNSGGRARVRRLSRDWLPGKGRRRLSGVRASDTHLPARQRGRFDARGVGGGATVKIYPLIGSLGIYCCTRERSPSFSHAQLMRMSLRQVRDTAVSVPRVRTCALPGLRCFRFSLNVSGGRSVPRPGKRPRRC